MPRILKEIADHNRRLVIKHVFVGLLGHWSKFVRVGETVLTRGNDSHSKLGINETSWRTSS